MIGEKVLGSLFHGLQMKECWNIIYLKNRHYARYFRSFRQHSTIHVPTHGAFCTGHLDGKFWWFGMKIPFMTESRDSKSASSHSIDIETPLKTYIPCENGPISEDMLIFGGGIPYCNRKTNTCGISFHIQQDVWLWISYDRQKWRTSACSTWDS